MRKLLLYGCLLLFLTSCTAASRPVCDQSPIPPLVNIQSILDESSGELISAVRLSNFYINGKAINPNEVFSEKEIYQNAPSLGLEFEENSLLCKGSCKFGAAAEEGMYKFDVSAEGYKTKTIEISATYEKMGSGCGEIWKSLVNLEINLEAE